MPMLSKNVRTPALVQTSKDKVKRPFSSKPTKTPKITLLMTAIIPGGAKKTCHLDLRIPTAPKTLPASSYKDIRLHHPLPSKRFRQRASNWLLPMGLVNHKRNIAVQPPPVS